MSSTGSCQKPPATSCQRSTLSLDSNHHVAGKDRCVGFLGCRALRRNKTFPCYPWITWGFTSSQGPQPRHDVHVQCTCSDRSSGRGRVLHLLASHTSHDDYNPHLHKTVEKGASSRKTQCQMLPVTANAEDAASMPHSQRYRLALALHIPTSPTPANAARVHDCTRLR